MNKVFPKLVIEEGRSEFSSIIIKSADEHRQPRRLLRELGTTVEGRRKAKSAAKARRQNAFEMVV